MGQASVFLGSALQADRHTSRDFQALADRLGFSEATAIPVSAVLGDNVARRSQAMPWYRGPSLPGHLDAAPARSLDARLVWLSDQPFARERGYLLRTATDLVPVASLEIAAHLDLDALTERPAATCAGNDIAVARVTLGRSAVVERYVDRRDTGSFVLVDAVTGATVAGGIVARAHAREGGRLPEAFRITRSLLRQGIGADLGDDVASERELRRRADEVAILLRGAGVAVEIEDRWRGGGIDARTVWLSILATLAFGFATAIVLGAV